MAYGEDQIYSFTVQRGRMKSATEKPESHRLGSVSGRISQEIGTLWQWLPFSQAKGRYTVCKENVEMTDIID